VAFNNDNAWLFNVHRPTPCGHRRDYRMPWSFISAIERPLMRLPPDICCRLTVSGLIGTIGD
jgi:hypothetical protein